MCSICLLYLLVVVLIGNMFEVFLIFSMCLLVSVWCMKFVSVLMFVM